MENQIYRLDLTDKYKIELFVCDTNTLNPRKDIKAMSVDVFLDKEFVACDVLDHEELKSLIKYLVECKDYMERFNESSKPTLTQ